MVSKKNMDVTAETTKTTHHNEKNTLMLIFTWICMKHDTAPELTAKS